jgi:hypothetical protein
LENAERSANAGKNKARRLPHVALNAIKGAEFSAELPILIAVRTN